MHCSISVNRGSRSCSPSLGSAIANRSPSPRPCHHRSTQCRVLRAPRNAIETPNEVASEIKVKLRGPVDFDAKDFNLPTVLDMAGVAWQNGRAPRGGRQYENRLTDSSSAVYMVPDLVQEVFAGLLKVEVVEVMTGTLDELKKVRVTLGDKQAVVGYHSASAAHMWIRTSEPSTPATSLSLEVVTAKSREGLLWAATPQAQATLDISGKVPGGEATMHEVVLGEITVKVAVSLVGFDSPAGEAVLESVTETAIVHGFGRDNPSNQPGSDPMRRCARILGDTFEGGFWEGAEPLAYIESSRTLTHLLVYWNRQAKQIVIRFDGTNTREVPDSIRQLWENGIQRNDVVTNIKLVPVVFDETGDRDMESAGSFLSTIFGIVPDDVPFVHRGFLEAWRSVQPCLGTLIQDTTGGDAGWKVTYVGHSLGGSLAELGAASAAAKGASEGSVALYTFGAARVGNRTFYDAWSEKVPEQWRVFNQNDLVPDVPRITGFVNSQPSIALMEQEGPDGLELAAKVSFPDREPEIAITPGVFVTAEAKRNLVVPFPAIEGVWGRLRFEANLIGRLISGKSISLHSSPEYMEHLISITRSAVLDIPPQGFSEEERKTLEDSLSAASALVQEYEARQAQQ